MKPQHTVALFIETSSTYGRQILRGVQRFMQTQTNQEWFAVIEERDLNTVVPEWAKRWQGDGIISRQVSDDIRDEILERKIAFVELADRNLSGDYATVRSDDGEIGRMGAEHLRELGLTHFAFCGFRNEAWSQRRKDGFEDFLTGRVDTTIHSFESDWYAKSHRKREDSRDRLRHWLMHLPKPVGVMACNDVCGKQLIDCCHHNAIEVPESVAVVGVDNDDLLCSFCAPPLSSVQPNAEHIGFRSASLLSEMLSGELPYDHRAEILIPPLGVIARGSSDIIDVGDQELAVAIRYIREAACQPVTVNDVARHCSLNRRSLERKMRSLLGRTPQQEIQRVRLRRVCSLLAGSELSVERIASDCGYDNPEYLYVVFKREMRMTPGEYRSAARAW